MHDLVAPPPQPLLLALLTSSLLSTSSATVAQPATRLPSPLIKLAMASATPSLSRHPDPPYRSAPSQPGRLLRCTALHCRSRPRLQPPPPCLSQCCILILVSLLYYTVSATISAIAVVVAVVGGVRERRRSFEGEGVISTQTGVVTGVFRHAEAAMTRVQLVLLNG